MRIVERVVATGLPLDQVIVIGSGILDALHLREARDIDLVVTPGLFQLLKQSGDYSHEVRHDEDVLERNDQEIWTSWDGCDFEALLSDGTVIDGVQFAHPQFVLDWKQRNGRDKDARDIQLLEKYLRSGS